MVLVLFGGEKRGGGGWFGIRIVLKLVCALLDPNPVIPWVILLSRALRQHCNGEDVRGGYW